MIITCEKCTKKFNIEDNLIPNEGRLLQCGSCQHKWFYKKANQNINIKNEENKVEIEEKPTFTRSTKNEEITNKDINIINKTVKNPKKEFNIVKVFIVIFISAIAFIILVDTFKLQLEEYVPGINFILNNLYETLKDLLLFSEDLLTK
tara:strand:+ start:1624 stop:2067 length:444 start_codon:yes stop_codon:yes gene_type:complete